MVSWGCKQYGNYEHDWLDCPECIRNYEKEIDNELGPLDPDPEPCAECHGRGYIMTIIDSDCNAVFEECDCKKT